MPRLRLGKRLAGITIPKTSPGIWAVALIGIFCWLFVAVQLLIAAGQRGGATFFSNLLLTIPVLLAAVSGVLAFFTGIIGIVRSKERAVLVFLATVIGLFVIAFLLGEILFQH